MKTKTKIWLFSAAALVLAGLFLFGGVMMALGFNFAKLSTVKYETNEYEITDPYNDIRIEADTADILFLPSGDGKTTVVCHEEENQKHTVSVRDGVLSVKVNDTRAWYEHVGIRFGAPKVTVYLPAGAYGLLSLHVSTGDVVIPHEFSFGGVDVEASTGDVTLRASEAGEVRIKTTTGAIRAENIHAATLSLSVSTGSVTIDNATVTGSVNVQVTTGRTALTDLSCRRLYSEGSTGKITLTNTFARERIEIKRSTGDVTFGGCDATEISVRTTTGSVRGSLASPKDFDARSGTGRVRVPDTTTGGRCEIRVDTGDIHITLT